MRSCHPASHFSSLPSVPAEPNPRVRYVLSSTRTLKNSAQRLLGKPFARDKTLITVTKGDGNWTDVPNISSQDSATVRDYSKVGSKVPIQRARICPTLVSPLPKRAVLVPVFVGPCLSMAFVQDPCNCRAAEMAARAWILPFCSTEEYWPTLDEGPGLELSPWSLYLQVA